MTQTRLSLRLAVLFILGGVLFWPAFGQVAAKAKESGRVTYTETLSGKGGTVRYTSADRQDEFLIEPKTYIRMRVEIIEIKPTETKAIASPSVRAENGGSAQIVLSSEGDSLSLTITPTIEQKRGVALKVEYQRESKISEIKGKSLKHAFVRNGDSAVVELFTNKDGTSKLALKITPLIEVVEPTRRYPAQVRELHMEESFLIKNDDKLVAQGSLSATSEGDETYLWFLDGGELMVLGFQPFEGAEPLGYVLEKVINIKIGDDIYRWSSRDPILPSGNKWLVWVHPIRGSFRGISVTGGHAILGKNGMIGIGTGKDAWEKLIIK